MTGGVLSSDAHKQAQRLNIENQPPSISNLTVLRDGEPVSEITAPLSGSPTNYTLEVRVEDFDGVSSVQAKIGRLAPIGQSETWMLLKDDGEGPDRAEGDGLYSLQFSARSSLWEGQIPVMVRATDVYLSMTPSGEQTHNLTIVKASSSGSTSSWVTDHSTELVVASMGALLLLGAGAFAYLIRNSEME